MKRTIIFITACFFIMLLPNIACSDRQNSSEQLQNITNKTVDVKELKSALKIIQNELNTNEILMNKIRNNLQNVSYLKGENGPIPQYIDQETLDYFTSLIGYQGSVDLSLINQLIAENVRANQIGHDSYIASTDFSERAKIIMRDLISEYPTITDLSSDPNFQLLSVYEQTMLLDIEVVTDPENRYPAAGCAAVGGLIGTVISPGVGTWIGILVGGLLCTGK